MPLLALILLAGGAFYLWRKSEGPSIDLQIAEARKWRRRQLGIDLPAPGTGAEDSTAYRPPPAFRNGGHGRRMHCQCGGPQASKVPTGTGPMIIAPGGCFLPGDPPTPVKCPPPVTEGEAGQLPKP